MGFIEKPKELVSGVRNEGLYCLCSLCLTKGDVKPSFDNSKKNWTFHLDWTSEGCVFEEDGQTYESI